MHSQTTETTPGENTSKHSKAMLWIPIILAALLALGLVLPIPFLGRAFGVLFDIMHGPAFALFATILVHVLLQRTSLGRLTIAVGVWVFLVGGGVFAEILQSFIGRTASWHDIVANTLGVTAGILFVLTRNAASRRARRWALAVSIFLLIIPASHVPFVWIDCIMQKLDRPILASFEGPLEMMRWKNYDSRMVRTPEHATHGNSSLRVEFDKTEYPAITSHALLHDWSAHEALAFDVTVDDGPPVELLVRVQDAGHTCGIPNDKFEKTYSLSSGTHKIIIPLPDVANAPADRQMNLRRISDVQFYLINPDRRRVLHFDNIRLE